MSPTWQNGEVVDPTLSIVDVEGIPVRNDRKVLNDVR